MHVPAPLGDAAETRRALGIDDEQQYINVVNQGSARILDGLAPELSYKDVTDPTQAYLLARAEWRIRAYKQIRPNDAEHLMQNLKYIGEDHYKIFLTPWADQGRAAIRQLQEFARWISSSEKREIIIEASMNGVTVLINQRSRPELIRRDWLRALDGCIEGPIGPRVPFTLSDAELRNDQRIITERAVKRSLEETARKAELKERQRQLDSKLASAPEMEVSNSDMENRWREIDENTLVVAFGTRWARLMQVELATGKTLEEVVKPTYWLAHGDLPALFGSEVGAATSYLVQTWTHGDRLGQFSHLI